MPEETYFVRFRHWERTEYKLSGKPKKKFEQALIVASLHFARDKTVEEINVVKADAGMEPVIVATITR